MDNTGGMGFAELLAQPGVFEEIELRSRFGFLAFHGGPVERVTTMIARMAAERSGSSFYAIDQPEDRPLHIPSIRVDPAESPTLTRFYEHVDAVCTVHGYGRDKEKQWILLGGRNRELASLARQELEDRLSQQFRVIDELEEIPKGLRGVHDRNPVNVARQQGVQVELPPGVRWNWDARQWGDAEGLEPTATIDAVVDALTAMATGWLAR